MGMTTHTALCTFAASTAMADATLRAWLTGY